MEYYLYLFIRYLKEKQLWASCDVYYFYMLKIIKDNLNGIWRQLYSNRIISWINIQSLDVNIDVSLLQSDMVNPTVWQKKWKLAAKKEFYKYRENDELLEG